MLIADDAMFPYYNRGEYIAGAKHSRKLLKQLLGEICIVKTCTGHLLLRVLQRGSRPGFFNLIAINPKSHVKELNDIAVIAAVPVLWVRRKNLSGGVYEH